MKISPNSYLYSATPLDADDDEAELVGAKLIDALRDEITALRTEIQSLRQEH